MNLNIFVYGTLKSGYGNHDVFLGGIEHKDAVTVEEKYSLKSNGFFPAMFDTGVKRVIGEVYNVSPTVMKRIDMLEGNGHFYERKEIPVLTEDGEEIKAWAYFMKHDESNWRDYRITDSSIEIGGTKIEGLSFE